MLFRADPSRGELLSAEQTYDEELDEIDDDDDLVQLEGEETLTNLIKDPLAKKKQMLTPQQYRVVTIGPDGLLKEG